MTFIPGSIDCPGDLSPFRDKGEFKPGKYHPSLMLSHLSFVFIYPMYIYNLMSSQPLFNLQIRRLPWKVKGLAQVHRACWWKISDQNSSVCMQITLPPLWFCLSSEKWVFSVACFMVVRDPHGTNPSRAKHSLLQNLSPSVTAELDKEALFM